MARRMIEWKLTGEHIWFVLFFHPSQCVVIVLVQKAICTSLNYLV